MRCLHFGVCLLRSITNQLWTGSCLCFRVQFVPRPANNCHVLASSPHTHTHTCLNGCERHCGDVGDKLEMTSFQIAKGKVAALTNESVCRTRTAVVSCRSYAWNVTCPRVCLQTNPPNADPQPRHVEVLCWG